MTRGLALALTALTGFSGLVYEVAWEKYLATMLGSHSEATAAVLAIFLGGLSLGYALFGRVTRTFVARGRGARLLVLYGFVEGGIGVYVLLFPAIFPAAVALSSGLPRMGGGLDFAFDVVLAAILIGPPTILMGGTIPILTQALARSTADSTRFHALVYALNTAGAFLGALAAGFVLIPSLGLAGSMHAMGLVNLAAGLVFGLLGILRAGRPSEQLRAEEGQPVAASFATCATAALLVGFAMMSIQTVLIRMGALSLGASQFTFSMVVATFVSCIALGSLAVSVLPRIPRLALVVNQWLLVGFLFVLYQLLPYAPYGSHVLRSLFRDTDQAFYAYHGVVFLSILLFLAPVVTLSGATLPLLFHTLRGEPGGLGSVAGRLYSWNTVGSLLGALLGGYLLLFWLQLDQIFLLALASLVLAATLLCNRQGGRVEFVGWGLFVLSIAAMVQVARWDPFYLAHGTFRQREPTQLSYAGPDAYFEPRNRKSAVISYEDDPTASVAVLEIEVCDGIVSRSILNNGKSDGNTYNDYPTVGLLATIPALLAERVEQAFVVGLGTGVTVGELALLPSVERVVVSEISPAVVRAAPLFDFANHGVTKSPKVEIIRTDAYRSLLRSDERFDVIVSEPSNPWVQGMEMLYSREFLEAVRDHLRPGGVYAQWTHLYATDDASIELVLRTHRDVFDQVSVWFGRGMDLIVLGFAEGADPLNVERLIERAEGSVFRPALERAGIGSVAELLAHEVLPLGVVAAARFEGPLHTLTEPILGYTAARAFYNGERAELPFSGYGLARKIGSENSLLRRTMPRSSRDALFRGLCGQRTRECVALLSRWHAAAPGSARTEEAIELASRKPLYGSPLTAEVVYAAARLHAPPGQEPERQPLPLSVCKRASAQYARFFTHAVPFSAEALLDVWGRCQEPEGSRDQCARGRKHARALVERGSPEG
jgi:spermidine synthase